MTITYELSSKARVLALIGRILSRWPPKNALERIAVGQFMERVSLLSEEECKRLLDEAHRA